MSSIILRSVARVLIPVQLAFSLFLLLRGHNEPGGGFAAGLVVATAVALHAVAFSPENTVRLIRIRPMTIAGLGLTAAVLSGVAGILSGEAFLTGYWMSLDLIFVHWEVGTPLLFDLGVYLLVIGMTGIVILNLMEEA